MNFFKYQALGNDYIVVEGVRMADLSPARIIRICDRHFGVGSDGILLPEPDPQGKGHGLRILNPDGSEAEKSGNGLRIFARYLWDQRKVGPEVFPVHTAGGRVFCQVRDGGQMIFVEMGHACFESQKIPVAGPPREVVRETIEVGGRKLRFTGVTVGNPHCVIHLDEIDRHLAETLGPLLERHPLFPNRINVQFVKVLGPDRIQVEIWERGAGYTLASGSSSCAAAAASVKLGYCKGDVTVVMPGGTLKIGIAPDFALTMEGPARKVAEGVIARELLDEAP